MPKPPVRCQVGDTARMKKSHPCGSDLWEITRTGMDFGLKCLGCGRRVMIPRPKFERGVKEIYPLGTPLPPLNAGRSGKARPKGRRVGPSGNPGSGRPGRG